MSDLDPGPESNTGLHETNQPGGGPPSNTAPWPETYSPEPPKSNTLSVLALIFAILIPIVGLVLALVSRSQFRRSNERPDGLTIAALVVSIVLTCLVILAVAVPVAILGIAASMVISASTASQAPPSPSARISDVAVVAEGRSGLIDAGDLASAAETVLLHRLNRANVSYDGFQQNADGQFVTSFSTGTDDATIQHG